MNVDSPTTGRHRLVLSLIGRHSNHSVEIRETQNVQKYFIGVIAAVYNKLCIISDQKSAFEAHPKKGNAMLWVTQFLLESSIVPEYS